MNKTSNDVLNYLSHLKEIKQKCGPTQSYSYDDGIYTIFDSNNIPVLSLSQKIFDIFQEIEV